MARGQAAAADAGDDNDADGEELVAAGANNVAVKEYWFHPMGFGALAAPQRDDMNEVWIWQEQDHPVAASTQDPELLILIGSELELAVDDNYRLMNKKTHHLSSMQTHMRDVGGRTSCKRANENSEVLFVPNPFLKAQQDARARLAGDDDTAVVEMTAGAVARFGPRHEAQPAAKVDDAVEAAIAAAAAAAGGSGRPATPPALVAAENPFSPASRCCRCRWK